MSSAVSEELIAQIRLAFSDGVYPGDDELTLSLCGEEPEALAYDFRGKTAWETLEVQFLDSAPEGRGTALSFVVRSVA
jgi:hypothetical protein